MYTRGYSHVRGISTLNFGPFSTKLGRTVRAIKKMTPSLDIAPSLGGGPNGKVVALGILVICPAEKNRDYHTKN